MINGLDKWSRGAFFSLGTLYDVYYIQANISAPTAEASCEVAPTVERSLFHSHPLGSSYRNFPASTCRFPKGTEHIGNLSVPR